jgi:solute carrier family 25 S-adenosylmethionine transporter 26
MATDSVVLAGVAGLVTAILTDLSYYPIDIVRAKVMGSTPQEDLTKVKTKPFAGYHLQLMQAPTGSLFFASYQLHRGWLLPSLGEELANFTAAALSELYACSARNPFEVLKQQLQVGRAQSSREALRRVLAREGWAGLATGLGPSLVRDMPFAALQLLAY